MIETVSEGKFATKHSITISIKHDEEHEIDNRRQYYKSKKLTIVNTKELLIFRQE